MGHINKGTFDHMVENAIRFEPLAELPVDFSQLFFEQVKAEEKPKFQVLSLVDIISSMILAITIGIAFLIPAFLPEQLSPLMQWYLQWGEYWLTKAVFSLPGVIIVFAAGSFIIAGLFAAMKGIQLLLKTSRLKNNVISLF